MASHRVTGKSVIIFAIIGITALSLVHLSFRGTSQRAYIQVGMSKAYVEELIEHHGACFGGPMRRVYTPRELTNGKTKIRPEVELMTWRNDQILVEIEFECEKNTVIAVRQYQMRPSLVVELWQSLGEVLSGQ